MTSIDEATDFAHHLVGEMNIAANMDWSKQKEID
jgi:hypothetical protein